MRRLAALLPLMTILAGCTAPTADLAPADEHGGAPEGVEVVSRTSAPPPNGTVSAEAAANPPPAAPPASLPPVRRVPFGVPVELPLVGGIGAGEPNIAALPDGTLFITSPTGLQSKPNAVEGAAYLWRSTDGGATWETLRGPDATMPVGPFCSCDADVIGASDGTAYYSDWWDGNYLVESSTDGGETWSAAPVTTREAVPFTRVDRQWLVPGEGGSIGLFYSYFSQVGLPVPVPVTETTRGVHAVFSTDRGLTWGQPVVVVDHGVQISHPRTLPDGTLVMPYGEIETDPDLGYWRSPSRVMLAVSSDGGATWAHMKVADAKHGFDNLWAVQADVDASGAIHVGWSARVDDDTMATYLSTSRDAGASWTTPLALRSTGLNFLPWVAATDHGTVAVGWYGSDATGDPVKAEDATWYAYVGESRDGGETFAVHRVSEEPVKKGPLCPRGASCEGDRELLDYVSLVYDASGNLHYAYARSAGGIAQTLVATALAQAD